MVESRTENLDNSKSKILSYLKINGPTIPIKISNYLGVDTILASAFLADLLSDKQIKISSMKVGNSPIYFLSGQEEKLQNFSNYLGGKERQAFELLKEQKILRDNSQEPAIRVALRSIKDFAFSFSVRDEVFWRFYLVNQNEAIERVSPQIEKPKIPVIEKIKQVFIGDEKKTIEPVSPVIEFDEPKEIKKEEEIGSLKEPVRKDKEESFTSKVENYLNDSKFQIVRKIVDKKKDYILIIRLRNSEMIRDYLCICKDKKSITETDVMKYLEDGKKEKLPVFVISSGEPNKKAQEWIDYLNDGFVFRKLA